MKLYNLLLFTSFMIISQPSISEDMDFDNSEFSSLFNPETTDRILLVGFSDQHINRVQRPSAITSYHRRGPYQSSTWSKRITTQIGDEYGFQKLTEWPMTEVGIHCVIFLVPPEQSMEQTITLLAQDKRVNIVQRMHRFKMKAHKYNDPYFKLQANMHMMEVEKAHSITTGRNINIAMIDTGVDMDHPDLNEQIETNKNFVSGVSSSLTNELHGTAVAGILVARTNNKTGIIGVAPDARLTVLEACWPNEADSFEATCNSFTLALAVNTAIKLGVDVLNMSLAGPQDPLLEILLKKAIEKGIIVVAADPGYTKDNKRFPASLKNVISVQTLQITDSNKRIQNQSINAPGQNILTTLPHGTYDFISGSSLSAAHVSGITALLLQLKPDLTVNESINILQNSVIAEGSATNKGLTYGINANVAVLEICDEINCPNVDVIN